MLTEREIFDRLKGCVRAAISDCEKVATRPESGAAYISLRANLKLAEGCCRQAAHWREDTRWLEPGRKMEQAHQIARAWLHRPTVQSKKLFTGLAAALRKILGDLERVETMATGRVGAILPIYGRSDRRPGLIQVPALTGISSR